MVGYGCSVGSVLFNDAFSTFSYSYMASGVWRRRGERYYDDGLVQTDRWGGGV